MSRSGTDADPRILGQLLAAQSTFSVFSTRHRMGEFVCRAVEGIPGVGSCAVCMPGAERPLLGGEPIPECADCDVPEGDIDHDPGLPCRLPSCTELRVFPLRTQDRHFGFFLLKVNEPKQYAPYEPFVSNLIDGLAVNVERQWQKDRLHVANDELLKLRDHLIERTVQLEAANKELEAFSYSVSHDLRTPLRAIDGFSAVVLEDYIDKLDDAGKKFLSKIRSNIKKMSQLIDDLLEFSRLGRQELRVSNIDMGKLAMAVSEELKLTVPERKLKFNINTLIPAQGDQAMIRQVFVNLLSNAIKFTKPKERAVIEVDGRSEGNENVYTVKDNGVGFDMHYIGKLFFVFQRLHSASEFEGTGVGLAIVQRIIHRHGGRVWAEGKVGVGASFYFSLPTK